VRTFAGTPMTPIFNTLGNCRPRSHKFENPTGITRTVPAAAGRQNLGRGQYAYWTRPSTAMTKQPTLVAQAAEEQSDERAMYLLPVCVYQEIIEACRPFYEIEQRAQEQAGQGTLASSSDLKIPIRFDDSVALSKTRQNNTVRRLVSPSPEVRVRRDVAAGAATHSQFLTRVHRSAIHLFPGKFRHPVKRFEMTM
jgi:hypothetical protein